MQLPLDDCWLVLPHNAVHSTHQTKQIPNDPPQMGAKSTTTCNHPSTPGGVKGQWGGVKANEEALKGNEEALEGNEEALRGEE